MITIILYYLAVFDFIFAELTPPEIMSKLGWIGIPADFVLVTVWLTLVISYEISGKNHRCG